MERINRALKLRIYPLKEQQQVQINKTLGSCRFIYNQMLGERISTYEQLKNDKEKLYKNKYKSEKEYKTEFDFLKEADSTALQQARLNLIKAYSNFYNSLKGVRKGEKIGFPKFKSKHNHNDSYRTVMNMKIDFEEKNIAIAKCGKIQYKHRFPIKSWYRLENTVLKSITISREPTGKYFASLLFEGDKDFGEPKSFKKVIGLDMSLQNLYVDSEGKSPEYKRNYRRFEERLAVHQYRLTLKTKGSRGYEKQRIKTAKVHEKIRNKRKDFNHKLSLKLVRENDVIVVENLNLKGMSQCLNLGKSVMDMGYGQFVSMLKYKSEWNEKTLVLADKWFASSKLCHVCGNKKKDLMLNEREWDCPVCGTHHQRDLNAAINLVNLIKTPLDAREGSIKKRSLTAA
jgi:putative transposase